MSGDDRRISFKVHDQRPIDAVVASLVTVSFRSGCARAYRLFSLVVHVVHQMIITSKDG